MGEKIRRWPQGVEIAIALVLSLGPFFVSSQQKERSVLLLDDSQLLSIVTVQVVMGALTLGFLRLRGWKWADFEMKFTFAATLFGILLVPISQMLAGLSYLLLVRAANLTIPTPNFQITASLASIIVLCIINSLYEELFVTAYLMRALEKMGGFWKSATVTILFSALLRTSYHTYQGAYGVVIVLPLGILWAWYFHGSRNLWPLVLAHGLIDLGSLLNTPSP